MNNRPTPETDAAYKYWPSENAELVDADFARNLERERDDYKWQLHIAKGEIEEARKMERAWTKEETK